MPIDSASILVGRRVLITGVAGTVGGELARQLLAEHDIAHLLGVDHHEHGVFLATRRLETDPRARVLLADVRDADRMAELTAGIDVVFHAAALKHVLICERSPNEATATNVHGTQHVVDAAIAAGAQRVVCMSTDKAVAPSTVMGHSKRAAEQIVTVAASDPNIDTICACTRFGNVLGSSGSVIPIFKDQIERGGPVTVTDERMTRFVMSLADAVRMVIDTASLARGGEVFVTKMPVIRITDLARVMIHELAPRFGHDPKSIDVQTVGAAPGEKIHEALLDAQELHRTIELDRYFVALPPTQHRRADVAYDDYPGLVRAAVSAPYDSATQPTLDDAQLLAFLTDHALLD